MNIVFVGNHSVDYSTETHHRKTLEAMGHQVTPLQEGQSTAKQILSHALQADMLIWTHTHGWLTEGADNVFKTLKQHGIPTVTYHLDLWLGLKRQEDLKTDPFYKSIEHFFTVDKLMADWFNDNTSVKGHYLQAGVFDQECYVHPDYNEKSFDRDVIFVGSKGYHPEWSYRPQLIDWLASTFGNQFTHVGGDGQTGTVRGDALNRMYATTKVAVGDTLCIGFDYPYYWSDRVYETLGRGGFLIHPYIKGMEQHFVDKQHLVFYEYGNFEQLEELIDYYFTHDEEREAIRLAGHEHVKKNHTYRNRWEKILKELEQ